MNHTYFDEKSNYVCDICDGDVFDNFYYKYFHYDNYDDDLIFNCCHGCLNDIEFVSLNVPNLICHYCKMKDNNKSYYTILDQIIVCQKCKTSKQFQKSLNFVDKSVHKYIITNKYDNYILLCYDDIEIDDDDIDDLIENIIYYDYDCNENIKNWKIYIEATCDSHDNTKTGFLINKSTGQIASYVIYDYNRVVIEKAYDNEHQYITEYTKWKNDPNISKTISFSSYFRKKIIN